jgi:hypothetical protein
LPLDIAGCFAVIRIVGGRIPRSPHRCAPTSMFVMIVEVNDRAVWIELHSTDVTFRVDSQIDPFKDRRKDRPKEMIGNFNGALGHRRSHGNSSMHNGVTCAREFFNLM